ncbi:hypothetical protein EYR40_008226 [Pleurotus pulmonarius]|nr:hypothetical protein EYR36_009052 [Pleurotus pulmonarius]KAF4597761.1 hypothetical protein EYR40_008226 [Pleurotus pulmonarius]
MPTTSASTNGSLSQSANTTPAREFQYKQQVQPSTATERALASPLARAHRAPPPADAPPLQIHSTPSKHTLCVQFPQRMGAEMRPEMVTVCAKRGDRLGIVADAWHLERNCESFFCVIAFAFCTNTISLYPFVSRPLRVGSRIPPARRRHGARPRKVPSRRLPHYRRLAALNTFPPRTFPPTPLPPYTLTDISVPPQPPPQISPAESSISLLHYLIPHHDCRPKREANTLRMNHY